MTNRYQPRGIEVLRLRGGGRMQLGDEIFAFTAVRGGTAIVPGRFLVDTGSRDSAGRRLVETATAADTASGGSRDIVCLAANIFDSEGRIPDIQYAGATTAGLVQGWTDPDLVYGAMMSGVPTAVPGSFKLAPAVPVHYDPATEDTDHPVPVSADKLDSTSYDATLGTHAFSVIGQQGNIINRDTAAALYVEFTIHPDFKA